MQLNRTLKALAVGTGAYVALAVLAADSARTHSHSALPSPVSVALADTSGTRLKASYIAGSDGSKLFDANAIYDSQLGVDCSFALASDGQMRCLPAVGSSQPQIIRYTDAQCTQPVVVLGVPPVGCPLQPPKYVWANGPSPVCPTTLGVSAGTNVVYSVGSVLPGVTGAGYERNGAGQCTRSSSPQGAVFSVTQVPASTFVPGTAQIDP